MEQKRWSGRRKRLTSSKQQEAVKRRKTGAHRVDEPRQALTDLLRPGGDGAGHEVVVPAQVLGCGVVHLSLRKPIREEGQVSLLLPKPCVIEERSAYDVYSEVQRSLEVRRHHGVVQNDKSVLLSQIRQGHRSALRPFAAPMPRRGAGGDVRVRQPGRA